MDYDIVVDQLTKRYGEIEAVKGVSFSVERGEVFGILGPNGAGKTTTLECIEGLQAPTTGSATVLGLDSQRDQRGIKERIGVQLQASAYFDYLTLREILDLFGRFYRRRLTPEDLLDKVNLADKAKARVKHLSGGQRQRFAIAATLVNDPELIFLDEPTTGLDPQARHGLWEFIQQVHAEGRTVVLTTHYMEEAQFLCDRVAIMDQGKIVVMDTPTNLVRSLEAPYEVRLELSGGHDGVQALQGLEGVVELKAGQHGALVLRSIDATRTLRALFAWATDHGVEPRYLEVVPATLEDVFLAHTGRALQEQ